MLDGYDLRASAKLAWNLVLICHDRTVSLLQHVVSRAGNHPHIPIQTLQGLLRHCR